MQPHSLKQAFKTPGLNSANGTLQALGLSRILFVNEGHRCYIDHPDL